MLEAHLGLALTQRQGRGLALTDSGRTWHGEIARHLRAIALAAERVRPGRRVVQVTVVQSFGSRWLMPRLTKFTAREPEIEVRIDASPVLADLARDPFDLAIREGRGVYPEADSVTPVPAGVLSGRESRRGHADAPAQRRPSTGRSARLLHEVTYDYWPDWIAMAAAADVDVARGLFFSHTMLALDAAVEGQGVALAPLPLRRARARPRRARARRSARLRTGHRHLSRVAAQGLAHAVAGGHRVPRLADRGSAGEPDARSGAARPRTSAAHRRPSPRRRGSSSLAAPLRGRPLPFTAPAPAYEAAARRPYKHGTTMTEQGYLRHPRYPRRHHRVRLRRRPLEREHAGGTARRLTAGLGEPSTPCLSPDGRWLAFVSRDEQHPEVYLMPAEGGPARRMTWLGPDVMVRGFTPDGRILFVTTHGQPFFRNYRAYTLDSRRRAAASCCRWARSTTSPTAPARRW